MSKSLTPGILSLLTLLSAGCGEGVAIPESQGPVASPEAAVGPKADDPWAWLCQDAAEASDGVCTDMCFDFDPDCAVGPDLDDFKGPHEQGEHEGGLEVQDPEPEESVDECLQTYRYADGQCDEDCSHPDPDCVADPGPEALAQWEVQVCGRFPGDLPRLELATSLCIEREGSELVHCIAHCARAFAR